MLQMLRRLLYPINNKEGIANKKCIQLTNKNSVKYQKHQIFDYLWDVMETQKEM